MNYYVHEKLNELEAELRARKGIPGGSRAALTSLPRGSGAGLTSLPRGSGFNLTGGDRVRPAVFGPVLRATGRTLRRLGEGIENWASPPQAESEDQHRYARRRAS